MPKRLLYNPNKMRNQLSSRKLKKLLKKSNKPKWSLKMNKDNSKPASEDYLSMPTIVTSETSSVNVETFLT